MAAGIVVGGCVLMPVLQSAWWGVVWIRQTLKGSRKEKFYKVRGVFTPDFLISVNLFQVDEKQKELQDSML